MGGLPLSMKTYFSSLKKDVLQTRGLQTTQIPAQVLLARYLWGEE